MAKAEKLIQAAETHTATAINYGGRQIPFRWMRHPVINTAFERQMGIMVSEGEESLQWNQVPDAVAQAFSQPQALEATKHALFQGEPQITGMDAMFIQMGGKAFILLGEMATDAGKAPFAIHIGRNPANGPEGDEAAADFHNLSFLSQQAEEKLPASLQGKFRFLKPITLGEPVRIGDRPYSWFTMPFIEEYGELKADIVDIPGTGAATAYFRYSLTQDEQSTGMSRRYENNAHKLLMGMVKTMERMRGAPQEKIAFQMERLPEAKMIMEQYDDLLLGNALVYLLSGGHFPAEFALNAGDWMAKFVNDRLHLYLITVRGGWKEIPDDEAFVREMLGHSEPLSNVERHNVSVPLFYGREAQIRRILEKAHKLLKM